MNELIFRQIAILSPASKTAKIQKFSDGINVVTSPKSKGGNWVGKSSLLKSLYHTMGADCLFDSKWGSEGDYIYVVTFTFNNEQYSMFRYSNMFKLYDSNNKQLFVVANRGELAKKLSSIFGIKFKLKDQSPEKKYVDSLPVYWYMLNFTDQFDSKPFEFRSFDRLGSASNYYNDLIYSHLGVRNASINELNAAIDDISREINGYEEQKKIYEGTYNILKQKNNVILNEEVLKESLAKYEKEYKDALNGLNEVQAKLEKAYAEKADLETLLSNIDSFIANQKEDIKKFEVKSECPHCGTILENNKIYYFRRVRDIDGFGMQKISVEKSLAECERKINLELEKYNSLKNTVDNIKNSIQSDKKINKDDITSLGLTNTINDVLSQINIIDEKLLTAAQNKKDKEKLLKELSKTRKEVDEYYCFELSQLCSKYPIPGFSIDNVRSASDKFTVGGTVNNVVKMIWISALLRTRYIKNKDFPVFPVVVDTPNNADFDVEVDTKIFDIVFSLCNYSKQIIVSLIGFEKEKFPNYPAINVINLTNKQNQLLNTLDFELAKSEYDYLGIFD